MKRKMIAVLVAVQFFLLLPIAAQDMATLIIYKKNVARNLGPKTATVIIDQSIELIIDSWEYFELEFPAGEHLVYFGQWSVIYRGNIFDWSLRHINLEPGEVLYFNVQTVLPFTKSYVRMSEDPPEDFYDYVLLTEYTDLRSAQQ